ncbi:hypothetical protein [Hymenobacter sp.]|uniref:hypothetical protein n=1 Tax=Hymenobacter sp. TaxID=1898978 RepID=UPI002ED843B0
MPEVSDYVSNTTTASFSDEVDASLCLCCGEPLAWHEEACSTPVTTSPKLELPEPEVAIHGTAGLGPSPFAYAIGQPVQPVPAAKPQLIIWRGQVKERHPRTGLLHRVNVYRLDNGYWDCYFEAELQAA